MGTEGNKAVIKTSLKGEQYLKLQQSQAKLGALLELSGTINVNPGQHWEIHTTD